MKFSTYNFSAFIPVSSNSLNYIIDLKFLTYSIIYFNYW